MRLVLNMINLTGTENVQIQLNVNHIKSMIIVFFKKKKILKEKS